jgi:hypothetical protein
MTARTESGAASSRGKWKFMALSIAAATIGLFAAANAHLVYVAVASQPDCVAHVKDTGGPGTFRAAKPAC